MEVKMTEFSHHLIVTAFPVGDPDVEDISHWDPEWFGAFRKVTVASRKATFIAYDEATVV